MEEEKRAIEPQNSETPEEKPPFTPSSKSKRIFAWVLFGIVIIAIILDRTLQAAGGKRQK